MSGLDIQLEQSKKDNPARKKLVQNQNKFMAELLRQVVISLVTWVGF